MKPKMFLVYSLCAFMAAVLFGLPALTAGSSTAVPDAELARIIGAQDCGCSLEAHSDCKETDGKCAKCAGTSDNVEPSCSGTIKDWYGSDRHTCKNGDDKKKCNPMADINCWIEKYCSNDGEYKPNTKCYDAGCSTDTHSGYKCRTCKIGTDTGQKEQKNNEECVAK